MNARPILLAALLIPSSAAAATLTVGPGGTYATINGALGNANDGDTLEIEAGTYVGALNINNDVTLVGLGGSGAVTVQSGGQQVFNLNNVDVVLEGLTVQGNASRGFFVSNGASLHANDVQIVGFDSNSDGGGMLVEDASVVLIDCLLEQNNSNDDGGGIDLDNALLIADNTVFRENTAGDQGGAIRARNSEVNLDGVTFVRNESSDGSGILSDDSITVVINSRFERNNATNTGAGIRAEQGSELTVTDSTFTGNSANYGGAIYGQGLVVLSGVVFQENQANVNGGALRWFPDGIGVAQLLVESSVFRDNTAGDIGGGIASSSQGQTRGAIEIYDTDFTRNSALRGGGFSSSSNRNITVQRNIFCSNNGTNSSGGARVLDSATNGQLWSNNVFVENTSTAFGGGLFLSSSGAATVTNNSFLGNDAPDGGHLYAELGTVVLTNNILAFAPNGGGFSSDSSGGSRDYNLWWSNTPTDVTGALVAADLGPNAVFADPMLSLYQADSICGNDAFTPDAGSPAIDAGNPTLFDLDGSVLDIGAYGGPSADPGILIDDDGDGFNAASDCDDNNAAVFPGAQEVCDGVDNDCDGDIDGALAPGATDWFPDRDQDGFGADTDVVTACDPPDGFIATGGDCADRDDTINPSATEICDGIDNDCDDVIDDGLTTTYYLDSDGDGYGDPNVSSDLCDGAPPSTVTEGGDCDDSNADLNPGAEEICDGIDNDCNGDADSELYSTWYRDADGDTFGNDDKTRDDCVQPQGFVDIGGDCNDENAGVNPDALDENIDTVDQDCDGSDGQAFSAEALNVSSACGCSATGNAMSGWWAVFGLMGLLARRRRS